MDSPAMKLRHYNVFWRVLALLALLLFAGDLLADAIVDMSQGHCEPLTSQSAPSHEKTPCSHCSCPTHAGAVAAADFAMTLGSYWQPPNFLRNADEATPPRLASSIDHPPQLA